MLRKGFSLIVLAVVLFGFVGCQDNTKNEYLIVDIRPGDVLTYKMVSDRDVVVDLDPEKKMSRGKSSAKQSSEKLEITAEIRLKTIDEQGYMVVEMSYPSVKVSKTGVKSSGTDSVQGLQGKTTTLKMTPAGLIVDDSQFVKLVEQLGEKSLSSKGSTGNIKNQDMIADFVTLQYYMWDAIGSIKNPLAGVEVGQSWSSQLHVPLPLLSHLSRIVEYRIAEIQENQTGRIAVIDSSYTLEKSRIKSFPLTYGNKAFQQRGFFGVLRIKPKQLSGQGRCLYDLDRGVLLKDTQQYTLETGATLFMPLPGTEGGIMKVQQNLSVELVD